MSASRVRSYGLKKRCACARAAWSRCPHPWHFGFYWAGHEYRYSLHAIAKLDRWTVMSKVDALALADRLRAEIRTGTHVPPGGDTSVVQPATATVSSVASVYLRQHVWTPTRRPSAARTTEHYVRLLERLVVPVESGAVPFGTLPFGRITKADIEAAREARRAELRACTRADRIRPGCKGGEVGVEHLLMTARHLWNWAIAQGFTDTTPFKRNGVTVLPIKAGTGAPRTRRLAGDEEARLLAAASPHLRHLIVAALETGCRLGELLSLQWHQVRWEDEVLLLPATKTKTAVARDVPVTATLRTVLEARRDGLSEPRDLAYVFGDESGARVKRVITAWRATCRRGGLADLHFHDLRREFASRLLESGVSNHAVRDWLGHTNLTTTNRYLSTCRVHLHEARRRFEQRTVA